MKSWKPSLSNENLQASLYYNALFSIFFAILVGSCSIQKVLYYNKKVSISVVTVWCIVEPIRLYYGWSGNLREKVPQLATFLLISLFPQFPFMLYLAYIQPVRFPVDPLLATFMLAFLVFEFAFGLYTIRQQIRSQTIQFMHLCEVER